MAGNSRDLTVNLVGKSDRLAGGLDAGRSSSKFTAIGVTIGNLMSQGISQGISQAVEIGVAAVGQYFDGQDVSANLQASLGLDPATAREYGETAGNVYLQGWGSSIDEAGNAVASLASTFGVDLMEGGAGLEALTSQALAMADVFGVDVTQAINSAGTLFKSGLAGSGQEAFDLLTRGMQEMPLALRGELLDATEEYSQFFGQLGISGTEAFGLLVDASADGQYGIDKMGDAIKEFTIRATDGSALTSGAFDAIGLDMDDMSNRILAGGDSARGAFEEIVNGLLSIEDPTAQANAAIALFGTPLEDLGTGEIPQFLEGLAGMEDGLTNVEGAAQAAADTVGGTTRAKFEAFKRQALDKLIEGGVKVVEYFKEFGVGGGIQKALGALGGILKEKGKELLNGLWQGTQTVWDESLLPWLKSLPGLAVEGLGALGGFLADKGKELLDGLWQGIQSVWDSTILPWLKSLPGLAVEGLGALGGFLVDKGAELLSGLGNGIVNVWDEYVFPWLKDLPGKAFDAVPGLLDTLLSRGRQLLNGLRQGALNVWNDTLKPWLADMGTKALLAVPGLLDTLLSRGRQLLNGLRQGALNVWNDTLQPWLAGIPSAVVAAVPAMLETLKSRGTDAISGLLSGATARWADVTSWANGLGSSIVSAVGDLSTKLYQKGRDLIQGFINGILDMIPNIPIIGGLAGGLAGLAGLGGGGGGGGSHAPVGMGGGTGGAGGQGSPIYLHDGGIVPGPLGDEVLAVLQAGERVVPIGGGGSVGAAGNVYHVTVNMPPGSNGQDVLRALQTLQRTNGPLPLRIA